MDPYRYPYGYHPAPPPVDPGGVTPITTNQQGVAMMAPQGYISAAPSPAYPVYYGGAGAVPLGGSVPPVATVPSTWGMHYGPGMAGVEYPAVTAMPGAYPTAGPVTTRELTQFPSPGSESVSTTYMPYASRGEFVSLASGNFGSPYVVPSPTSPPSVTRMSVGSVPSSSSEGVCSSTSSVDSASAHRSSLEDQEVRDQLRQFRHMLEGLERRLDNRLRDSPQPRQPVVTPPGFAAFPLAEPHPSLLVEAPAVPLESTPESSVQPPAAFTMGQAREQRVTAASGLATTVTRSAPAVSTVAPVTPRVSTSVVLPSGTATVALPGRPQVPLGRGFLSASRMASAATQAPGRISVPRTPALTRTPSPAPPSNPGAWQQVPYRNRAPAHSQQPRRIEAPSVHEHQLTHVPASRAEQRAESVSAPPAPPSSTTTMKTKRRKPSQLARESRLRKCFNCGERGHLSLECARPCYKCNIAGHHSARCPYSVNRAPGQEASSSSHSSAQSTPERPVRPISGGNSSPAVTQPPTQGVLPSDTPAPHSSLGRGLLALSTFLPLPPAGRGAQLLAALHRNRSAAASETRQPAPSIPSKQQSARTATTAEVSAAPPSTATTLYGLSTASSRGQQQRAAGASTEASSASAAVPGPSSPSTQAQPQASSNTAPKVQPQLTPSQGQSLRGQATGQSASSSSGAQGASSSSSSTRAIPAINEVTASSKQQPTPSRRGKKSPRGKRSTRDRQPPPPPPSSESPFPYDGDAHAMWQTLRWQKDLMLERGTVSKDELALNCQQRFIMRDLEAGQRTAELSEEQFREYISQLPPLASSKEELRTLLFSEDTIPMEVDSAVPATCTEHESSTPSERCVASPVETQARPQREMSPGRLSPVSPSEAALLSSSDEGSSSSTVVAASPLPQEPTDSSSTVSGITGFPHASGVSVGQSRCPIPHCAFVGGMEKMGLHALDDHLPWYVRPDLHCDQCQGLRFESDSQMMVHTQQEHGNVPAGRLREGADNLSACLIFLATHLCDPASANLYGLLRYVQLHHANQTLDIPFLWGMSLSALDLVFLQSHQLPPLQLGSPLTALPSVACLLHWQVLLALASHLSRKERDALRCYLVTPPHHAAPSPGTNTGATSASAPSQRVQAARTAAAKAHQECQRQMLKGTPRALPEAAPLGGAFSHLDYLSDSHFHLHWLVKERLPSQSNRSVDLESLRQTFSTQEPSAIPLGTAVDSCLLEQSRRLPSTRATNSAVWLALGAHPNMAGKWNAGERTEAIQELKARLLENAGQVVAIGEIGIDLSLDECTSAFEGRQVSFLQEFVSTIQEHEALRSLPLVLHIRDRSSKLKTAPTVCAQALVDAGVPRDHKIYWHCFTGTSKDAEKWLETFPNTLFGVSPRAITSRPEVTAFFGSAPLEQLLVETDSPKLQHAPTGRHGIAVRSPYHVGEVYKWLANLRNMGSVAVLSRTINRNYATFYNVPHPCWWREYVHVVFTKFPRQFWFFGNGMFN